MKLSRILGSTAAALLISAPAFAQMYEGYDSSTGYEGFQTGLAETGNYEAWDSNDDMMLDDNEFATGVYSVYDRDNDVQISEDEFMQGNANWMGGDTEMDFATWDADGSGYIDQSEFAANWDRSYMSNWDTDGDMMLNDAEFSQGAYNAADMNQDQVITIEEEGWFEGWFDGDDIEAEITDVGSMY